MSKEFNKHVEEHVDHTPTGRRGSYLRGSIVSIDRPNRRVSIVDDVFGEIVEDGPNYRDVGWVGTVVLMMKTQVGLGVLSIPAVFDALGMIPGTICLITVGVITTWSNYVVGVFKLNHRNVYGIDDACGLVFGRIGLEVMGIAFCLYMIFVAGSAMLGISIALNAVSSHGTCTAAFVAVAAITACGLGSIQTLGKISWLAWVGVVCIMTAIFAVTIAVGVQDRPDAAPKDVPFVSDYKIVSNPSFTEAITAVSSLVFAWAGTPSFFPIVSEMRDPRYYTRSLLVCQAIVMITYLVIGIVVYYHAGSFVSSPALGTAGSLLKKISYGISLPGLMVSNLLPIHIAAKYLLIRLLRGSKHLTDNTIRHWVTWLSLTIGVTIIAYIIASAIPVFGGLVSLIGALLGTLMCFVPMGFMWLHDNYKQGKAEKKLSWKLKVGWAIFVIVSGLFLMVAGTFGSIAGIIDSYKVSGGSAAFSCADNSNSVGGH